MGITLEAIAQSSDAGRASSDCQGLFFTEHLADNRSYRQGSLTNQKPPKRPVTAVARPLSGPAWPLTGARATTPLRPRLPRPPAPARPTRASCSGVRASRRPGRRAPRIPAYRSSGRPWPGRAARPYPSAPATRVGGIAVVTGTMRVQSGTCGSWRDGHPPTGGRD